MSVTIPTLPLSDLNPLTWISSMVGAIGGSSSASGQPATVNISTIMALLGVAEAFGVNPAALTPAQMTAIQALMVAMGYAVPNAAAVVPAHA